MALNVDTLSAMTTAQLNTLRDNYRKQKQGLPKQGTRHTPNLVTDLRRCDDAIRIITRVLQSRQKRRAPLASFAS